MSEFPSFLKLRNSLWWVSTHSSVKTHLGSFRRLATVSNAAVNIGARICLSLCLYLFRTYTHKWNCWIIQQFYTEFFEEFHTVFIAAAYITFLPATKKCSNFPTTLPTLLIFLIPTILMVEVVPHCRFELHFPDD